MQLDAVVVRVADHKDEWASLSTAKRITLLRRCLDGCVAAAPAMVRAGCEAKGLRFDTSQAAEEWLSGPVPVVRNVRLLIETLSEIDRDGAPRPGALGRSPTGELTVDIFPRDRFDAVLYPHVRIGVWMEPGIDDGQLPGATAAAYRRAPTEGRVALVLGAGNVASIGPMDVLYKLFVEKHVVVLKTHPLNAYLGPSIEQAFAPLVSAGFLAVVAGDVAEGQYLVQHPAIDEVHITGSAAVHDRIVWGDTPEEQASRRATRTPKLAKRITSELGCVTPVIAVPGEWTTREIEYQARNVATMIAHNASCNCNAAKLIVTWRGWTQRRDFLRAIESVLSALPQKCAYYPGSAQKYAAVVGGKSGVASFGRPGAVNALPYATLFDLDPTSDHEPAFCQEAWSPVIGETALPAPDDGAFLDAAARFCNERVSGTLSCVALVDSRTRTRLGREIDSMVAALRYGTVAINHWSAMSYALAVPPWGAYPGHSLHDIGSGIGFVHNTLMFDRPLKTVLTGPLTTWPTPPWFSTHRHGHVAAAQMVRFEASPAWIRFPGIAWAAMRG